MAISNPTRPLNLLLYAAVPHRAMLGQGFYAAEIDGLRMDPRVGDVVATNTLTDVRKAKVDGIVSYFYSHSAAIGAIAKRRGIPAIATGGCEQLRRNAMTPGHVYAARVAAFHACTLLLDSLLATSTTDFERMRNVAIVGRDKIQLSFHGVATAERADRRNFERRRDPAGLVTIAGLDSELNVRRKGVLEAVDLLANVYASDPSASLTIIGRDSHHAMVQAHAEARGVVERLRFTGYVTERQKLELLHRARFYVQLSEYEGFGIGALEGLAQGCQVIHSGMGGLQDTIGGYGIVLPRDAVDRFDIAGAGDYAIANWPAFEAHLARFGVAKRADTIIRALGLSEHALDAMLNTIDRGGSWRPDHV